MVKLSKTGKKGFTLVEMVLVIAIIVILAAVLILGIGEYLQRARNAASSLAVHNREVSIGVAAIADDLDGTGTGS